MAGAAVQLGMPSDEHEMLSLLRWLQVTFTATVVSASDAQLLGPSNGVVQFSVSGTNAFSYVHKTLLGTAKISRAAVSGTASLTMHKDSAGLTLLPGLPYSSLAINAILLAALNCVWQDKPTLCLCDEKPEALSACSCD